MIRKKCASMKKGHFFVLLKSLKIRKYKYLFSDDFFQQQKFLRQEQNKTEYVAWAHCFFAYRQAEQSGCPNYSRARGIQDKNRDLTAPYVNTRNFPLTERRTMSSFCVHKAPCNSGCLSLGVRILWMLLIIREKPLFLLVQAKKSDLAKRSLSHKSISYV